jgi:hypothetical protein
MERDTVDCRSDRMPSAEGLGRAGRAWLAYGKAVEKLTTPLVGPIAEKLAGAAVIDPAGFWLTCQLEGGFEGLQRIGMSRASIYQRIKLFRKFFGAHPDEFEFPGVQIDVLAYLNSGSTSARSC